MILKSQSDIELTSIIGYKSMTTDYTLPILVYSVRHHSLDVSNLNMNSIKKCY